VSKQAGLRAHERRGLEDELKRRRADRRDRLERAAVDRFERLLSELEADLGAADVAVERCAHASLALRAQLDGAVDFVRDGALVGRLRASRPRVEAAAKAAAAAVEAAFVATCVRDAGAADGAARRRVLRAGGALGLGPRLEALFAAVWNSNLQPDFNVRVCDSFDIIIFTVLRELDESNRFVQKSAESTSI